MKTEKPDITLKYQNVPGGQTKEWRMDIGKGEKGPGQYDKLVVGKGHDGIFTFEIKTPHISFNPINPIEITVDGGGAGKPDQFMSKIVGGNMLVVADPNTDSVATDYYYKLNFVGADPLDPVITNGCCKSLVDPATAPGGIQLMSVQGAIAVLVAATILALLFNAIPRLFK